MSFPRPLVTPSRASQWSGTTPPYLLFPRPLVAPFILVHFTSCSYHVCLFHPWLAFFIGTFHLTPIYARYRHPSRGRSLVQVELYSWSSTFPHMDTFLNACQTYSSIMLKIPLFFTKEIPLLIHFFYPFFLFLPKSIPLFYTKIINPKSYKKLFLLKPFNIFFP